MKDTKGHQLEFQFCHLLAIVIAADIYQEFSMCQDNLISFNAHKFLLCSHNYYPFFIVEKLRFREVKKIYYVM